MKKALILFCMAATMVSCAKTITIDDATLMDKIRGGWYAQTIGCTFGGPTEFRYNGRTIPDSVSIEWYDNYIYDTFSSLPGLYDDVYMDLSFLEVMAENGIDAPQELYANKFANASFSLWHANQAARYNILNGCPAPESGFWKNNPHADDIDFQIESDFIGMLTPGRPDLAVHFCDKIGHIMNYGDGWYGGVFTAAMYSYAYVCDDVEAIVCTAAKMIPEGTRFRTCIDDVIDFHAENPNDWKECWEMIQEKHSFDIGCPDGVWSDFDIDAVINAAYVVTGLLYGEGDFLQTMEISTRCGQDSDCNPASAAGILGVIYGYNAIPENFRKGAELIADMPFPFTSMSLNQVCDKNLELIKDALGDPGHAGVKVKAVKPSPVWYEQSFEGITLKEQIALGSVLEDSLNVNFNGTALVIKGGVQAIGSAASDYTARIEVLVDGIVAEEVEMPADFLTRKLELFYKYGLESGSHTVSLRLLNPDPAFRVFADKVIVYE